MVSALPENNRSSTDEVQKQALTIQAFSRFCVLQQFGQIDMMDAFPATKIPLLDSLDAGGISAKKLEDAAINDTGYRTISGPIQSKNEGDKVLPLTQRNHQQLLHHFAGFILDFTGDDDISFDFLVLPDGNGRRPAESGAARATISKDQDIHNFAQGSASSPFEQRSRQMKLLFQPGGSDSDFGIIISNDVSTPPLGEAMARKLFLLVIDASNYSCRLSADRIPTPLVDAVVSAAISSMNMVRGSDTHTQALSVSQPLTWEDGFSVLNHPPLTTPPDFGSTLDLQTVPTELRTHLLHNAFSARVLEHPDRPALDFLQPSGRISYSYQQLDDLSTALARRILSCLETLPYENKRNIAAVLITSPELYVAWLGVLKAGCTFCPLPVEAPAELLSYMVEGMSARIVLGLGSSLEIIMATQEASSIPIGIDLQAFIKEDHVPTLQQSYEPIPIMESDLAYIMHTSGSTGRPKGVQISHLSATCSIASHIVSAPQPFRQQQDDVRWFQFAAPTFDPSVMEIFITLSIGGTICACDRAMMLTDPEAAIAELGAGIMMATPSMASLLRRERVPCLRHLWTMGETLTRSVANNFAADSVLKSLIKPGNLLNAYGPTEGSINCALNPQVSSKQRGSIIGYPIPTCSTIILHETDYRDGPVPLGFPGELAIGGPQVSAGYLNRPDQTATSFMDIAPYGRLYRTGDRARLVADEDGVLIVDFLGRISSDQIKIAGKRVELGEIEAAMLGPCVAEAAAVAMTPSRHAKETTSSDATQLIAVLVPCEPFTNDDILLQCYRNTESLLQPHMRPSKFYLLPRLPRTASNKIDRKTLQQLCQSPEKSGLTPLGPDSPPEDSPTNEGLIDETGLFERVVNTISKTVSIEGSRVTPSTTLASLGIDSLRAVRLLQHARDDGLPSLQITDVLSSRTIGQLAGKYQRVNSVVCKDFDDYELWQSLLKGFNRRHESHCIQSLPYGEDQIESILPATTLQAVTMTSFVLTSGPSSSASASSQRKSYIYHTVCEVAEGYDTDRILQAWSTVVSRHDIMRTVFVQIDDELTPFAQCILSPSHPDSRIQATQYVARCNDEFDQLVEDAQVYVQRSMTLDRPPRYLSVVKSPDRNAIIFSMLHSLFDRGSLRLLLADVEREYFNAPAIPRSGPLIAAQRHFMADRKGAATFWNTYLEGSISPPFPCIRLTLPGEGESGCEVTSLFSELTIDVLQRKAANMHSSPLAVLQTAWALILLTYTGEKDIAFGSVVSGRFTDETQNCAAPVVTVHPIRIKLDPAESPRTIDITTARTEQNAEALRYLHAPISTAKYDTTFAFQSFADESGENLLYSRVSHPVMHNDQTMTIEVYPHISGRIEFRASYQCLLIDAPAANLMLADLARITLEILENPERPFLECQFSSPSNTLNTTTDISTGGDLKTQPSADNLLLHSYVEKWARDEPGSLALSFYRDANDKHSPVELTYQQLDWRAERIASSLRRRLSAQPRPHIIPICMEKCPELYIAVLGVLKAGAAWCPVDPQYPPARQRGLLERTSTGIVLVAQETVDRMAPALPDGFEAIDVATLGDKEVAPNEPTSDALMPTTDQLDDRVVHKLHKTDIAYIIFTSGTTGTPKAVPITHEAASSSINSFVNHIDEGLSGGAVRYLQFVNFTFDVFVSDLFSAWQLGGTLVSATRDILLGSLPALARTVAATHLAVTPSFASTLPIEDLDCLRVVCMGGEKIPQALADNWKERLSLYNAYGPAETAITVAIRRVTGAVRSTIIGRPLPTVQAWVMQDSRPLITHGLGELVIAGPHLSPGYWRDPAKDEGKFVWNEFLQRRVYRTGDVVRKLNDGSFDFVGRNDDLVKIRGMRVELNEIAAVCSSGHSSIVHAAVLLSKLPGSTEDSIICFLDAGRYQSDENSKPCIIVDEEAANISQVVANYAVSQLPRHMVPDVFIVLSILPKTLSAKVDQKLLLNILASDWSGLPPPEATQNVDTSVDPEWHYQHRSLLDKIKRITKIQPSITRPGTTLAQLGVDSIGAIKLSSGLKANGHNISAVQILGCQSIGDIISLIAGSGNKFETRWEDTAEQFSLYWKPFISEHLKGNSSKFRVAPATPMQEGVLVETLREPLLYWANFLWTLSEDVDIARLRQAWRKVVSLHEILRVGFFSRAYLDNYSPEGAIESSLFLQIISDSESVQWAEITSDVEDVQLVTRTIYEDVAEKHHADSFLSPPWKLTILTSGKSRTMILTIHHSLYDGEMLHYLLNDVAAAYTDLGHESRRCQLQEAVSRLSSRQTKLPALPFWTEALRPFMNETDIEAETDSSMHPTGLMVHRTTEIRAHMSRSQLARAAMEFGGSSLSCLIRVAYGSMLAELAESQRVLFAEIRSERVLDARLTDAMAPLVSTYPVPFTMDGTPEQLVKAQGKLLSRSIECGPIHPSQIRKIIHRGANEMVFPAVLVLHPSYQQGKGATPLWDEVGEVLDISVDHHIALNVFETPDDGMLLSLSVDESMMTNATQETFLHQLDSLLDNIVLHPKEPSIMSLTKYFPPALVSISGHPRPDEYPVRNQPGYHIERLAELHPEWKAVESITDFESGNFQSVSWTYQQLNHVSNQVAHFICDHYIQEQRIAMSLDRTLLSFAIILGIMKSGNTYVPIEVSLPTERKAFLLKDSGATMAFISKQGLQPQFLSGETHLIDVDQQSFLDSLETKSTSNPTSQGALDLDAYLLYTSGSTGTPKGVRVSRQNLSSFIDAESEVMCVEAPKTRDLGGSGKYLCLASRAFDVHICEMFLAWRNGMCAVTGERLSLLDNLPRVLKELHITHAGFVPSLLDQTGLTPSDTPDLIFLLVGGEKMTPRTQKIWSSSQRVSLVNAYGPTEVTIGCCAGRLCLDSDTQNIGKPIGDCVAHILVPGTDFHVKTGMPGELTIVGSLVANGYHNRPDAKGFCTFDGQRMYRTGDIVRMEPDGSIIFLGRNDDQVKVRGQRLELGEISEAVRSASADSVDAATLLLKHPHIPRQLLVSFIANSRNASGTHAVFLSETFAKVNGDLRQACQIALPSYMVPDFILPLSFLPLTESAKTDNKLLAKLFHLIPSNDLFNDHGNGVISQSTPSRELSPREAKISTIITSLIPRQEKIIVEPGTSIFQLGVDSISAVNISFKLKKLGFIVSVAQLLRNPTIEQLATDSNNTTMTSKDVELMTRAVQNDLEGLESAARRNLMALSWPDAQNVESIRPCLPLQEALVAHSLSHGSTTDAEYISHMTFELASDARAEEIRQAWGMVIREHETLRTCFHFQDDNIVQVVLRADDSCVSWKYISGSLERLEQNLLDLRQEISDDIITTMERAPPIRFTIASAAGSAEHQLSAFLMVSMHHGLYDMKSLAMIFTDFEIAYAEGTVPKRPSVMSLIQHVALQNRSLDRARQYWEAELANRASNTQFVACKEPKQSRRVFQSNLSTIEGLCLKFDLKLSALIQGIFGYVLAQTIGQDDVTFGVVLSGRSMDVEGIDEIAAPCITTIPQRLNLRRDGNTLRDIAVTTQKRLFNSMEYQHTSLRSISAWLGVSGPLFSSIFSFIRAPLSTSTKSPAKIMLKLSKGNMSLEYPLAIECEANSVEDTLTLQANSSLSHPFQDIESVLEKIELLTNAVLQGEQISVSPTTMSGMTSDQTLNLSAESDKTWSACEDKIRDALVSFSSIDRDHINKNAPFIQFGIDSITTIRFSKLLREKGLQVSGADVIRNPSVAALSRHMEALSSSPNGSASTHSKQQRVFNNFNEPEWRRGMLRGIVPEEMLDDISTVYPLTPLQAAMVAATLAINPKLYSHHHPIVLPLDIDVAKLKAAWGMLLAKHDILRTSFLSLQQNLTLWVGAVHETPVLQWKEIATDNLQMTLKEVFEKGEFKDISSFAHPPVRATVVRSSSELIFIASLHHATYDGVSINFIFQDLWSLYNDLKLPDRAPFHEAALAIRKSSQQSIEFWTSHLADYNSIQVPQTREEDARNTLSLTTARITNDIAPLIKWCLKEKVSIQTVVLLSVGKAVCSFVGTRDVVFGQVLAGRIAIDGADKISGPMLNTLPFRLRMSDSAASNLDVLKLLQEFQDRSLDYQYASLMEIQKRWRENGSNHGDLSDILFAFDKEGRGINNTVWRPYETPSSEETPPPSQYRLTIEVYQGSDGSLTGTVLSTMTKERAEAFLDLVVQCFRDITNSPDRLAIAFPSSLPDLPFQAGVAGPQDSDQHNTFQSDALNRYFVTLSSILSDVTGTAQHNIQPKTSIFSIGIDSILAIRVATACRKEGVPLTTMDIMRNVVVGKLCEAALAKSETMAIAASLGKTRTTHIVDDNLREAALSRLGKDKSVVEEVLPVLAGQEYHLALWLQSGKTLYEHTWVFHASQALDPSLLQLAWDTLRRRHTALRSCLVAVNGDQALQVVLQSTADTPSTFSVHTVAGRANLEETVKEKLGQIYRSPSSLYEPPVRLCLVQGGSGEDAVLLTIHHAAYDAWSMGVLIAELTALYNSPDAISEPSPSFSKFVQEIHISRQGAIEKERSFWETALGSSEPTLIGHVQQSNGLHSEPISESPITPQSHKKSSVMVDCGAVTVDRIESVARTGGITSHSILLVAFARALAAATGSNCPMFGYFTAGRSTSFENIESLAGPTLNMLPIAISNKLITPFPSGSVAMKLLQHLQEELSARASYEQSNLREVLQWAGAETSSVPYNAHLNILWNNELLVTAQTNEESLLRPWSLGVPADYASPVGLTVPSAVDDLNFSFLPAQILFVDIKSNQTSSGIAIGAGCDADLLNEEELGHFVRMFSDEISQIIETLSSK